MCKQRLIAAVVLVTASQSVWANQTSWVFYPSTYSHDPHTGARVAQYARIDPVEPLDDPRAVTSRYTRFRTSQRGADGSVQTTYEVQSFGNDRGGLDAQWERFHDAWRQSYLTGSFYHRSPAPYGGGYGFPGYRHPGLPGYGAPGYGVAPGYGHPVYGRPVYPHGHPSGYGP